MLLSFSHNFLFIHVYKVAGTSIQHALLPYAHRPETMLLNRLGRMLGKILGREISFSHHRLKEFPVHIMARDLKEQLPAAFFDSAFKFGFVRNPWDWQVSLYHFVVGTPEHPQHDLLKSLHSFKEYVEYLVQQPKVLQRDYLSDSKGNLLVDFVGRYESLAADFRHVCRTLRVKASLPWHNTSRHVDYRSYYDDRTRSLIEDYFAEDIETFGYTFENRLAVPHLQTALNCA
jgi:Sulfotransferase family